MKIKNLLQTLRVTPLIFTVFVFSGQIFAQKKPTPKPKASATVKIGGGATDKIKTETNSNGVSAKVKQIDADGLKKVLTPHGKPLLVNFWATWCDPCREEFPDLVKIDADYKGKIDFAVVSLDDLSEISRDVPDFLTQMKAEMPAYLLKTPNEDVVISSVSKNWQGGLPFTILYDANGQSVYTVMGKVKPAELRAKIESLVNSNNQK